MCHTMIFVQNKNKILYIFFFTLFSAFFSTLPSTQTIKVIILIFFPIGWPWKIGLWTLNMHFNPMTILQGLFLEGLCIDSDPPPPAFIGFCLYTFWNLLFLLLRRFFLRPGKSSRHAFLVGQFVLTLLPQYPSVLRWPQSPNKHTM